MRGSLLRRKPRRASQSTGFFSIPILLHCIKLSHFVPIDQKVGLDPAEGSVTAPAGVVTNIFS